MDIGNKMLKENLVKEKESANKGKQTVDNKQGCIKQNDYFAF
jgi:hypothetical protein